MQVLIPTLKFAGQKFLPTLQDIFGTFIAVFQTFMYLFFDMPWKRAGETMH